MIPSVPGGIYGTGEEANWYDGVPQPANFFGQPGWWYAPTNWYSWTDTQGQIWVSPNQRVDGQPDPSPKFACKINLDGSYVYQDLMANLRSGNANPFLCSN